MLNTTVAQNSTALNFMLTTSLLGSKSLYSLNIVNPSKTKNVVLQDITSVQMKAVLKIDLLAVIMSTRDIAQPRTMFATSPMNVVLKDISGAH